MTLTHKQKISLAISALLFSALACRSATRLIIPDTPTPIPTSTATATPTPSPTITPTPTVLVYEASCPSTLNQIMQDALGSDPVVHGHSLDSARHDLTYLVHYDVVNNAIQKPFFYSVKKSLTTEQKDQTNHEAIWDFFTRLIPAPRRKFISGFTIFTDGPENYLASVSQSDRDPKQWDLNVDFADSQQKTALTFTLLHEYAHLLTLNSDQVDISQSVYRNPNDDKIYQREVNACKQYFTGEGCSKPDSYINVFFDRFWPDIYAEWQKIDQEQDEKTHDNMLDNFYKTYEDQFVTDYAPTSPSEDIAESFAFFVLLPKPGNTSIANEKVLFFYEYPELVELRAQLLLEICTEFK